MVLSVIPPLYSALANSVTQSPTSLGCIHLASTTDKQRFSVNSISPNRLSALWFVGLGTLSSVQVADFPEIVAAGVRSVFGGDYHTLLPSFDSYAAIPPFPFRIVHDRISIVRGVSVLSVSITVEIPSIVIGYVLPDDFDVGITIRAGVFVPQTYMRQWLRATRHLTVPQQETCWRLYTYPGHDQTRE